MGFFDLNVPYLEGSAAGKRTPDNPTRKATRLKLLVKAMELGYTGVAYNKSIRGVMSDSDRCSVTLLSPPSLAKLFTPSFAASVKLHRELLGVPVSAPFRQYRRLTVSVETPAQANALNSGNLVLKTYDLVAVKPLAQNAFEQACKVSEVDLIAIDFSEKLPFRLKHPMIKAAIQRGVYFEITYASLIADVQTRRQVISNTKLLIEWTRGKNLIFSSAASSVNELRGPCDVSNLSCLLGLSVERAKAALSKNCRSLLDNALRKKKYYKGAIKVEAIPSTEQSDSKEPPFGDWPEWDPISSGEGDLLLDDIAKFFSASGDVSKNVKAIDFASIVDSKPASGLQVKGIISETLAVTQPPEIDKNILSTTAELNVSTATNGVSGQTNQLNLQTKSYQTSLFSTSSKLQTSDLVGYKTNAFAGADAVRTDAIITTHVLKNSNGIGILASTGAEINDLECISRSGASVLLPEDAVTVITSPKNIEVDAACDAEVAATTHSEEGSFLAVQDNELNKIDFCDVDIGTQSGSMDGVSIDIGKIDQPDLLLASHDASLVENPLERDQSGENRDDDDDDAILLTERVLFMESYDEMKNTGDSSVSNQEMPHTEVNNPVLRGCVSGKGRLKRRTPHQPLLFPFKRLLNPLPLKKKARTSKAKHMMG